jgi:histidinol-phosphate aminotransferase
MLPFLRSDLAQLVAYTPHPGGAAGNSASHDAVQHLDRLDTNECPYDLPADLKEKLGWLVQREIEANRYPDGGHAALKESIAHYVNESAHLDSITPDQISVGNGSDELIRSLLIATCLRGEGAILVAEPTFSMYRIIAETLGISVLRVGRLTATFEIDLAAAQSSLVGSLTPRIRAVFLVHPNSPTANALTDAELDWLRHLPQEVLVVIDEAYFEFSQQTVVGELAQRPNWVILRTFSKAFRLAAYRIGYAIAHPELAATLEKVRLPYNLPAATQAAASIALANRQLLLAIIPEIVQERERLFQQLSQVPALQVWSSNANFLFLRLRPEHSGNSPADALDQVFQDLRQRGTLIRKISDGLRITVGTPAENQRTLEHLTTTLNQNFSVNR